MRGLGGAWLCALIIAMPASIGGCATSNTDSTPTVSHALPDDLSVSIYQSRTDLAQRRLEVTLENDSNSVLTVTGVELRAPQFTEAAVWAKASTRIRAGVTADLPLALPAADCAAADGDALLHLRFSLGEREFDVEVVPEDPHSQLERIATEDCLAASVAEMVEIDATKLPRTETRGGRLVAILEIGLRPTGAPDSVTFESALGTTLLAPIDPLGGEPIASIQLGTTVDKDSAPGALTLAFIPNRCDAHAVADDKRGTVLPLRVTLKDGTSGAIFLVTPDAVKTALYAFVAEACGR